MITKVRFDEIKNEVEIDLFSRIIISYLFKMIVIKKYDKLRKWL